MGKVPKILLHTGIKEDNFVRVSALERKKKVVVVNPNRHHTLPKVALKDVDGHVDPCGDPPLTKRWIF